MPRPRLPPTPLSSTEIAGKRKSMTEDMESSFTLPPSALESATSEITVTTNKQASSTGQVSPPLSPEDNKTTASSHRKRTLSGASKSKSHLLPTVQGPETDLPPPPSRARKIIQMKPKKTLSNPRGEGPELSMSTSSSSLVPNETTPVNTAPTQRRPGQASATTAAGRKIARKTAHSIIERRRRSKMNEEFGVLKNMIPACNGVEMHKLAILQAGIEYVRYLEGCVEQLKGQKENERSDELAAHHDSSYEDDKEEDDEEEEEENMDLDIHARKTKQRDSSISDGASDAGKSSSNIIRQLPPLHMQQPLAPLRKSSILTNSTHSTYVSPALQPVHPASPTSVPASFQGWSSQNRPPTSESQRHSTNSMSPPPLTLHTPLQSGVSPAFNALRFSPDLIRTPTWSSTNGSTTQSKGPPNLIYLPQAAIPLPPTAASTASQPSSSTYTNPHNISDFDEPEATATAALLMMTKDRRGSVSMHRSSSGKGMSVRDLLIS